MEVLAVARGLNRIGLTKLADRVVTKNFGQQVGRTSKTGLRGFKSTKFDNLELLSDRFPKQTNSWADTLPESVITVIDKDFNIIGQTITKRQEGLWFSSCKRYLMKQFERVLMPKNTDPEKKMVLNRIKFEGEHAKDLRQTYPIEHTQVVKRTLLEPEKYYSDSMYQQIANTGNTVYDSYTYAYSLVNGKKHILHRGPISGGQSFVDKIKALQLKRMA